MVPLVSDALWAEIAPLLPSPQPTPRGGRPRRRPEKLRADKGYDYPRCRAYLRRFGIACRIARRGIESGERLGRSRWVGEAVRPEALTARLGITPVRSATKGDRHPGRPERRSARGFWVVDSTLPLAAPLSDHLTNLLDRLEPHRDALDRARTAWAAYAGFLCTLSSDRPTYNLSLPPDLLRRIAALGANLDRTLHASGDDSDATDSASSP